MTTILHVSDFHFGQPAVLEHIDALEATFARAQCDVIAFSGDFSQRARSGEFQRAAVMLREARKYSQVICVPGNHDVAWWYAPLGIGNEERLYENYQRYISPDIEPTLQVPGAFFVGINTSHGITPRTLTWNARDLSVIGIVTPRQLVVARKHFSQAPKGDVKVAVMHHNPVRGELSQRFGVKHSKRLLDTLGEIGVDLVLCGHDHQEAVTLVEREPNGLVVSTAGTVSSRSRGGRPSSYNLITTSPESIQVVTHIWSADAQDFLPGPSYTFARTSHAHTD
jgi:3',5'-cyclic AMP phosphodiesterase CpdA